MIDFYAYEKIVLDFLISKYEKSIEKVTKIFKSLDHDEDGVLNRAELGNTLSCIDPTNQLKLSREEFVGLCDPWNCDAINFSTYIKILSGTEVRCKNKNGDPVQIKLIGFSRM